MTKFCAKCGSRLNEEARLCPYCDAEQIKKQSQPFTGQAEPAAENTNPVQRPELQLNKKEKWSKLSLKQKTGNILRNLILGAMLCSLFISAICGITVYYGFVDIPIVAKIMNKVGIFSTSDFINKDINQSYVPNKENIIYPDENDGIGYVNNMILVSFYSKASQSEIDDVVNSINGTVVGRIEGINQYQIEVAPATYEELKLICERLKENQSVKVAIIDTVITIENTEIPNDPWKDKFQGFWGVDWDESNPDGYNWWVEAVKVPSAWEHNDELSPINVGIVDNGFDADHEDLELNILNSDVNIAENHGTHVAGVIGATSNNGLGISGILKQKTLYCYDSYLTPRQEKEDIAVSTIFDGISACLDNHCKVINISNAIEFISEEESSEIAKDSANITALYLCELLDEYDDFIIVMAAGNGDLNHIGVDAYKYGGFIASLDDDVIQSALAEYKPEKTDSNKKITVEDIKNSYMVVGAVDREKKEGKWQLAEFSNYGNSITICAPGVDIFSTVVSGGIDGNYGNMKGTSMATPIVSGITAMVWAANPDLSSEEVKSYILNTATETVLARNKDDGCTYYLINADAAVKAALDDLDNKPVKPTDDPNDMNIPDDSVEFNGHSYHVFSLDNIKNWKDAKAFCESQGGYLATITSQEENDFLYNYITQEGYSSAYFGLSDEGTEGTWLWSNGEELSYTNWHTNEPNGQNPTEDYSSFYYKFSDGTWNDSDFGKNTPNINSPFLCEWGEYDTAANADTSEPGKTTSDGRDIALVLDISGSMSGTPITETKKASIKFIDTILNEKASVGIVTYNSSASTLSDLSTDRTSLTTTVNSINEDGGTNIEAGLAQAYSMLSTSSAKKKIIVLMSDGEPNNGKEGDDLIEYANKIKEDNFIIYTLGFFENLNNNKASAQKLMEKIASDGCHYEVASADDLVFFFEDMADQINGQKYIYIRIACPVDVTVTYNGETLCSDKDNLNMRTGFGTLTFENNKDIVNESDRIKVLRLKEGADYNIQINGNGHGLMNYTIGFMDENGNYSDFRKFENVKITRQTNIDTLASVSKTSVLNIDQNGDGRYDLKLQAEENGYGEEVGDYTNIYIVVGSVFLFLSVSLLIARRKKRNKERRRINAMAKFCGNCGTPLDIDSKICKNCGATLDDSLVSAAEPIITDSKEQKIKKKIKKTAILIAFIFVTLIVFTVVSQYTGYNGLIRKTMVAYENYDIDTLISLSSEMYFYGEEDWVENYFKNNVGEDLDSYERSVGHSYKLTYQTNETYTVSARKLDNMLTQIKNSYTDFDTDIIKKIAVADLTVTAKQGDKSVSQDISIVMSKENNLWKLLYIE